MIRVVTAFLIAFIGIGVVPGQVAPAGANSTAAKTPGIPRTADGHPLLDGVWSTASLTPFQRPAELATKQSFSDEEARAFEQRRIQERSSTRRDGGKLADLNRAYNDEFFERGTQVARNRRTSLIVDPPDGRVPELTAQGKAQVAARREYNAMHPSDGPEDRPLPDRCIQFSQVGPPMLPGNYNNNYQIVQSPNSIAIFAEMGGVVRVIPIASGGKSIPYLPPSISPWTGDARGHWEGDTLAVETIHFSPRGYNRFGVVFDGPNDENLKVTERFTRTGPDTAVYRATVEDATIYSKPWTIEVPMNKIQAFVYEYACHEGNYGMHGILSGARTEERKASGR